jgi:hypothetical protein
MASTTIPGNSSVTITVPASSALSTYSTGKYSVDQTLTFANYPPSTSNVFRGTGTNVTSAFTNATVVTISAGANPVQYNVGTGPVVIEQPNTQGTPGTLNATGTLTIALITGGIVTSTTASAVTATLDTGTVCDAALTMAVNDAFDWSVINTGGTNAFTVTAATGHTVVGAGAVAASTSGRFRTRKTAANTMVTYRLS